MISAYFCTRWRIAAKSAEASNPHAAFMETEPGWSQSMPLARMMLSTSQRCSVQRRTFGSPAGAAPAWWGSVMRGPCCGLFGGKKRLGKELLGVGLGVQHLELD